MKTRAEKRGDRWILNGRKHYISGGHVADVIMVMAVTDPEKRARGGITSFLLERGTPGFKSRGSTRRLRPIDQACRADIRRLPAAGGCGARRCRQWFQSCDGLAQRWPHVRILLMRRRSGITNGALDRAGESAQDLGKLLANARRYSGCSRTLRWKSPPRARFAMTCCGASSAATKSRQPAACASSSARRWWGGSRIAP